MKLARALVLVLLVASPAWAGTIAIQITHSAALDQGQLRVALTVENTGDEAAHSVTPTLRFAGTEERGETQALLPPQEPLEASLGVAAPDLGVGRWPYQVEVEYADANLYPFQALSVAMLEVGGPPLPKLSIRELPALTLGTESEFEVTVKNVSDTPKRVRVSAFAPAGVEIGPVGDGAEIDAWEELAVPIQLSNRAALAGSRYPLFVTAEYDEEGVHQAVVAQTVLEIRPPEALVGERGRYLWVAAAVFGLAFVGLLIFRKRGRG